MNSIKNILFITGGILMVIGAGIFSFALNSPQWRETACWVYLVGAVIFSIIQIVQRPPVDTLVVRRLKRIQVLADLFFILAGVSMADTAYMFFGDLFSNYEAYLTYLYNKWVVLLLIAAVLELYTVHRIDHEAKKDNQEIKKDSSETLKKN